MIFVFVHFLCKNCILCLCFFIRIRKFSLINKQRKVLHQIICLLHFFKIQVQIIFCKFTRNSCPSFFQHQIHGIPMQICDFHKLPLNCFVDTDSGQNPDIFQASNVSFSKYKFRKICDGNLNPLCRILNFFASAFRF